MGLSSNSIIHFTKNKEALSGILKNNFKIKYCKERIELNDSLYEIYIPMVSFCDIPLSEMKNHINSYGTYGLGLSKEWAVKNKLNPVIYMEKNSSLSANYLELKERFRKGEYAKYSDIPKEERVLYDFLRYMKNYEGDLSRMGMETIKNYRFSDEREWRYVIAHDEDIEGIYTSDKFDKKMANKSIENYSLNFEPNDIKYVIIDNESEIEEFLEIFQKYKGRNHLYADIQRLSTRLLTSEQIRYDF